MHGKEERGRGGPGLLLVKRPVSVVVSQAYLLVTLLGPNHHGSHKYPKGDHGMVHGRKPKPGAVEGCCCNLHQGGAFIGLLGANNCLYSQSIIFFIKVFRYYIHGKHISCCFSFF